MSNTRRRTTPVSPAASPAGRKAIDISDLSFLYPDRTALAALSLSVSRGEMLGLLGPNGSGKTTLFKILSTMALPSSGTACIGGYDVITNPRQVRRTIGVVFQEFGLDKKLTVRENLSHQGHLYGLSGSQLTHTIESALKRFGLGERKNERVETLSGGLQRRVELVKGLLHKPEVLLLDEPSTGLDPGARRDLWEFLAALRKGEGITILLTTHLMEEGDRCDRVAIMDRGSLVVCDAPATLKAAIGGEVLRLVCENPKDCRGKLAKRFGGTPLVVDGEIRMEHKDAHRVIPVIARLLGRRLHSLTVSKPTLEDVYIRHTGHRFREADTQGSQ